VNRRPRVEFAPVPEILAKNATRFHQIESILSAIGEESR
jgi:hypothetical protein